MAPPNLFQIYSVKCTKLNNTIRTRIACLGLLTSYGVSFENNFPDTDVQQHWQLGEKSRRDAVLSNAVKNLPETMVSG